MLGQVAREGGYVHPFYAGPRPFHRTGEFWLVTLVLGIWSIELVNLNFAHSMNSMGVYPRSLDGLPGVLLWPLLHVNVDHLLLNTVPLMILGWFVSHLGARRFLKITLFITLAAGFAVWLLARPGFHLGASGLVFGYFGFLVARAWYDRSVYAIGVALLTLVFHGSILDGALPTEVLSSWEGHLAGLLAGVFAARWVTRYR